MKPSIMFLFGSGLSIPAGYPKTEDITKHVFSGENVFRFTDARYYIGDPGPLYKERYKKHMDCILSLITSIRSDVQDKKIETVDYEILFYLVDQLANFSVHEKINIAIYDFYHRHQGKNMARCKSMSFSDLLRETCTYIRHVVWRKLTLIKPIDYEYLQFLADALQDGSLKKVNIATLNHDLLLEHFFSERHIPIDDGFGKPVNFVRYWKGFSAPICKFMKLHGSIDWFRFTPDDGNWFDDKVGKVINGEIDHAKSPTGTLMMPHNNEENPLILTGTFNKIEEYSKDIYSDTYCVFRNSLKQTTHLVIAGYGFRDKGINTTILEWLYTDRKHKIVVIHPNPEKRLGEQARGAIRKAYTGFAKDNFILIRKLIENVTWKEIKEAIN